MSRSYKKHSFVSWHSSKSMGEWKTQENRRLRHNAKQLINSCEDYDVLIIPVINDYDTLWGSPQDGQKHYWETPLVNQCEVNAYIHCHRRNFYRAKYLIDGHDLPYCYCYSNKKGTWWKNKRK